jgi:hypothetical protein
VADARDREADQEDRVADARDREADQEDRVADARDREAELAIERDWAQSALKRLRDADATDKPE